MDLTPEQIQKNIERLRNKVGDARTGGKGSQRRKVKVVSKPTGGNDKVVKSLVKKVGAQPLGVDEINFFRDDNTVLHFQRPEAYASIQTNTFIVSGESQTKTIQQLLPGIIEQLGPKQHNSLKEFIASTEQTKNEPQQEAPDLVASTPQNLDKAD